MIGALIEIVRLLINTVGGLYLTAIILRFLLQLARADFYNPISQSLVLAVVVKLLMIVVLFVVQTGSVNLNVALALLVAVLSVLVTMFNIYFVAMIAMIILSWVAPGSYHPAAVLIHQIVEPVMGPFRRLLPPMGGIDFSPILAFLALNVVKILFSALAMQIGLHPQSFLGLLILNI
ncbi:MAG TPA: YggT family protein [Spongiibacteraceae bacterium]|nr:YggT family protein [Spongiibacteraceae bacterium]